MSEARDAISVVPLLGEVARPVLESDPRTTLFTSPEWVTVLAATYGFEFSASLATTVDGVAGLVPYVEIADVRGERIASLPFCDYTDPLVDDAEMYRRLIEPIIARGRPFTTRSRRSPAPPSCPLLETVDVARWHGVDLSIGLEERWAGLKGSARRNVRAASRAGLAVRESARMADLETFHAMHRHVRRTKYGLLAQPRAMFSNLRDVFGSDGCTVLLAEQDGVAVAGILFLRWRDTWYYKFNASVDLRHRPNDLLAWEGIVRGHERGLSVLDFGLSDTAQEGLVRYKEKYATNAEDIVALAHRPAGQGDERGAATGRLLGELTALLTGPDVPDETTSGAGDLLYRYFA